jgi:hypothetical protein
MRSKLLRLFLLFTLLICLPLQGLALMSIPSCQMHSSKMEMHMGNTHDGMKHCCMHNAKHEHKSTSCDKCTYCYLGVAQAIVTLNTPINLDGIAPMFTSVTKETSDPIPTSFYHPPRLTFA